ncbi:Bro-N domain-containing protein [Candidatus Woesearchaeota archaeon]|nr:Bro-N domain-containing protein [Candidatus Woesearchaeota archaeon]
MNKENAIRLFQDRRVRVLWDDKQEKWYLSIIDVVEVLTDSPNPRKYWSVLKTRLKAEGNQLATTCSQLKMQSSDGKYYLTDVGDTEQILRLIQSIPSKKAEPFKLWLAKVGNERIDETHDPELAIDRAMQTYLKKGYSKEWINQRLKTIEVRKELTDEWERVGIKDTSEFAILTNEITNTWSGLTVKEYKRIKNLKKENLRDNMSNVELVLNMLAEVATKEISKKQNPKHFEESKEIARKGGSVAGNARKEIEKQTGKPVVTPDNNLQNKTKKINFIDKKNQE